MRLVHAWLCQVLAFCCRCHQCFHASIAVLSHLCLFVSLLSYKLFIWDGVDCSNNLFFPINYAFFIHLSSLVFSPYSIELVSVSYNSVTWHTSNTEVLFNFLFGFYYFFIHLSSLVSLSYPSSHADSLF